MVAAAPARGRVLVVGGGPVGLYLGARLGLAGFEALVIERRPARAPASRAVGIHPPGIAALDLMGGGDAVRAAAVRLLWARARGDGAPLATLDLTRAGEVLTVPQSQVEEALEARLAQIAAVELRRAHELVGIEQHAQGVEAHIGTPEGVRHWRGELLVGCDGRASRVRDLLGIPARGGPYGDRYVMADLPLAGAGDATAEVVLHRAGVVESFPLRGARRWVVHLGRHTDRRGGEATAAPGVRYHFEADPLGLLLEALTRRLGLELARPEGVHASTFGVERLLADRFAHGRVALAGDAAHVLSPIGGQGMNLGWLDAAELARVLQGVDARSPAVVVALAAYSERRRGRARRAIRRAAFNTALGRPTSPARASLRDALLRRALRPPFEGTMLGAFTMQGLA